MPSSSRHHNSNHQNPMLWQERLLEACRDCGYAEPFWQIVSDRRGGRTAWSSVVTVNGQQIEARFWYDGKNLNNAKEDAAEAALNWLAQYLSSATTTTY